MKKPYAIIIMDGYGISKETKGNAIALEGSPNVKRYEAEYPSSQLGASGMSVGLPDGQMGNSEVGHLNMGAGRIVYQELTKITKEIQDGEFFKNEALLGAIGNAKKRGKKLHIWGLCSDGGVHSHNTHLYALLDLCKKEGLDNAFVHCFMDGRDVSPTSGAGFVRALQAEMDKLAFGTIASVCGRYYAMDRDNRWERVSKAYEMLTLGNGIAAENAADAIEESYKKDVTDEFILPTNVVRGGKPVALVEEGDSVIFFNFRPDRAREITRAFTEPDFNGFERKTGYLAPYYVCFTQYDATFSHVHVAFKPQSLKNTLGEYLASLGKKQLRIAETEKYAHVTFFFNGGVEAPNPNEVRVLVPSPKVATYDLKPEMSAYEVTDKVLEQLSTGEYDAMILNFANCDMVGHTGVLEAAEKAVATVDECVDRVLKKILEMGGGALLTADHGNADKMIAEDGSPFTAHTTNPVPVVLVCDALKKVKLRDGGVLADLAPTLLDMMGIPVPAEMTGKTLIVR
ncbi:MAG TPA: 2,3-bisphosphoglycerate-independent phosphoglycerate mutase [Candidatus Borkfalkia excrementigallinarum]|uniref:2,3-bisphosphoglycerate-independent phosphoglycerate mutase n=1 Tax=Candidatus Borkfalkia excrementigallinarum TaxID=2838506 RepID=A0A9D1ZUD9_9FIRM|nr:2,3-bisphosphoglycerate-independent phosphoglycerate mutase [Candidatus Borkfalkia excrementigallinarum]